MKPRREGVTAPVEGVWAVYAYDYNPYLISVWATEVDALRGAVDCIGGSRVTFLHWGDDLEAAIARDEAPAVWPT